MRSFLLIQTVVQHFDGLGVEAKVIKLIVLDVEFESWTVDELVLELVESCVDDHFAELQFLFRVPAKTVRLGALSGMLFF